MITSRDITINEFYDIVIETLSKYVTICFGNFEDLIQLDMNNFNTDTYFISEPSIESGKIIVLQDEELKQKFYKFCIEHEDRVFRGTKER